ncbi:hypothetical protein AAFF_G00077240 [Aldrovandia affinis]|uniref:Uncharacterized protein n=1 Tax=Aldrovandia affinis TaxID=143900 RepID=A0AAD7RY73_9TELE|nr:hypothetical protein AAFF_G00077240 [Aldrovandia affinis]
MPPKKKSKIVNPNAPPGVARAHLEVNFSVLPASKRDLKNGHILYLYTSFGKSRTETERRLRSHLSLPDVESYSSAAFNSSVKILVNRTLLKLKKLSNPKELEAFTKICDDTFKLKKGIPSPGAHDPESSTSAESQVPIFQDKSADSGDSSHDLPPQLNLATETAVAVSPEPTPSTSGVSTRSSTKIITPREQKLMERLDFLSTSKATLAQMYRTKIGELRTQLKTPKRVINQALKRKQCRIELRDRKIQELKSKLRGNTLAQELAETKAKLLKLRKTHRQLLKIRANRRNNGTVSIDRYRNLQEKIKNREEYMRCLELDNLALKESVENLEAASTTKSEVDGFECIVIV